MPGRGLFGRRDPYGDPGASAAGGARDGRVVGTLRLVRAFRRGLVVVFVAAVAGAIVKLRGKGGVPPATGGWRELEAPDFR